MADRKVFRDSVTPLPQQTGLTTNGLIIEHAEPEHRHDMMTVLFSLELPEAARKELEHRVENGEVVPPGELQQLYSADQTDRESLIAWLESEGFDVTHVTPDGTGVYASADVDRIEKSLAVNMTRVTKDGITYTAASN